MSRIRPSSMLSKGGGWSLEAVEVVSQEEEEEGEEGGRVSVGRGRAGGGRGWEEEEERMGCRSR